MTEQVTSDLLYLPGDPEFYQTLGRTLPTGHEELRDRYNGEICYVVPLDGGGTMQAVDLTTARDYLLGGEYELVEEQNEEIEQEYFVNCPKWMR